MGKGTDQVEFAQRLGNYQTTKGRWYGFSGWHPTHPLQLFDQGRWLECLHAAIFAASLQPESERAAAALEDDGVIHELAHLALGIEICTHNTLDDIRQELKELVDAAEAAA